MRARALLALLLTTTTLVGLARPASALPVFAHRFGLGCEVCHTAIPRLTPFGQAFLADGYRLPPSFNRYNAIPVALKINLAYSSAPDASGLPKAIFDEVELLAGAPAGKRVSYRLEHYIVDGGVPGKTRDAWFSYTTRPDFGDAAPALRVTAGEFTLPLPVDPETQRDTEKHYAIFDQTVGENPFDFFEDKIGVDIAYGPTFVAGGTDLHALVLIGHDAQSGLPSRGVDTMAGVQSGSPDAFVSAYRYEGTRPLGVVADRFYREGVGMTLTSAKASLDALAQEGDDSSADGRGHAVESSGGYVQLHWTASSSMFGVIRYDTISDDIAGATRSLTTSLVFKAFPNARLTLEDVISGGRNTLGAGWLVAY